MFEFSYGQSRPRGLEWRSSMWFITLVVGYGIMVDLMVYSVIIPVVPFQLERLGYASASALTGWLLFAYSVALVTVSPLCSWFSEKYRKRRTPMLWALSCLMGFLVMFMEAPNYPVMVVARVVQGISSSVVWIIGLALLADTVPEQRIGMQLGLAMSGVTIGMLAAPPIGGVLYDRFGFRAPFIFGIIITAVDFLGRVLVIERKEALRWCHDLTLPSQTTTNGVPSNDNELPVIEPEQDEQAINDDGHSATEPPRTETVTNENREGVKGNDDIPTADSPFPPKLSEYKVWKYMLTSRRTIVALSSIIIYGIVYTGLEPTLSLRLQDLYGFDSTKVGLVILASAIAAIFASPIAGWVSDRFGVEWITVACLMLAIPWYSLLVIRGHIPLFVASFALANFMMAALISPVTVELSSVVRRAEGVGFAHVYGFFNMAYGVGSAVGPAVSGQVYSHVKNGWVILVSYGSGLLLLCSIINFIFGGERTLASRLRRRAVVGTVA